jgi:23S rRNA pseudouridine955/2504/2580 synthase
MKIGPTTQVQILTIPDDREGQRLDNLLISLLNGVPKSRIYRILRKGEVRVNKGRVKPEYKVKAGDLLRLPPIRDPKKPTQEINTRLQKVKQLDDVVIQMEKNWLALNKPSGIAVHGGSGLNFGVIEGLRALHPDWPYLELVHRLDRETSGVLLIAKRRSTLRYLHQQLREKQIKKKYWCLVHGKWPKTLTKVDAPISAGKGGGGERLMRISSEGKESKTKFRLIAQQGNTSLIEAEPVTGRTHQIRVHCLSAGFPIVGDAKYVTQNHLLEQQKQMQVSRLMLHARSLVFKANEDDEKIKVFAPFDEIFNKLLSNIGYTNLEQYKDKS